MALLEETLFGSHDKVAIALQRLRTFEPPEGYYLAFSGGKDSQCVYHLCKEAGVKFDAHYSHTTVDPPEVIYFMREHYAGLIPSGFKQTQSRIRFTIRSRTKPESMASRFDIFHLQAQ